MSPRLYANAPDTTLICGDVLESLAWLDDESVQMCVTSPPYYGLRDYGVHGQIGLEPTPDEYIARMVEVFREVRRVLRKDGTLWLNIGDSYAGSGKGPSNSLQSLASQLNRNPGQLKGAPTKWLSVPSGCKPKDLIGIPWLLAFALRADGWYLRSDIIWHKPNPMPESVRDRPTKAHEYLFLLAKSADYYYDPDAIKEPAVMTPQRRFTASHLRTSVPGQSDHAGVKALRSEPSREYETRNKRSVWTVTLRPFKGAHFATFPPALVEPCVKAGSVVGSTVLDPFGGSGTVGQVARSLGRKSVLIDLNSDYCALAAERLGLEALCSKQAA